MSDSFITIQDDKTKKDVKIQLEQQPMVKQRAIVCRGTTCYRSKDGKSVVKLSWPSDLRPPEAEHLRRARDRGVTGVASLFGHHDITSVGEMRENLTFPSPYRFRRTPLSASNSFSESQSQASLSRSFGAFQSLGISTSLGKRKSIDSGPRARKKSISNSQASKLREQYKAKHNTPDEDSGQKNAQAEVYKNRIFSCLVISPAEQTIKEFESIPELLITLRDATEAHQSLLNNAKILHRDISENNIIIITDPKAAGGFHGMLIDLDLAIVDGERTGGQHMIGTPEFMAIDVLRGAEHTYRHDLKSFFYLLL